MTTAELKILNGYVDLVIAAHTSQESTSMGDWHAPPPVVEERGGEDSQDKEFANQVMQLVIDGPHSLGVVHLQMNQRLQWSYRSNVVNI